MTMRSKQWYTNASRLPNSLLKVSIGPLPSVTFALTPRSWNRGPMARQPSAARRERLPRSPGLAEGASAHADGISAHSELPSDRTVRIDHATAAVIRVGRRESGRRLRAERRRRTRPLLLDRDGIGEGVGLQLV